MCHFCERPCWRDGSDGGRECDYTDEEWNRMEREEWEELYRKYVITKPALDETESLIRPEHLNAFRCFRATGELTPELERYLETDENAQRAVHLELDRSLSRLERLAIALNADRGPTKEERRLWRKEAFWTRIATMLGHLDDRWVYWHQFPFDRRPLLAAEAWASGLAAQAQKECWEKYEQPRRDVLARRGAFLRTSKRRAMRDAPTGGENG